METYWEEVKTWREDRTTMKLMGGKSDMAMPPRPPAPSHIPSDEEIRNMFARARKDG